MAEGTMGDH